MFEILLSSMCNASKTFRYLNFLTQRSVSWERPSDKFYKMIYRVPGNNEPYKEEGKIYYDEADMNRKFEEFLYNTCRGTDFGKLKNDNTVKVQCQMVRKPSKKEAL